MGITVFFGGTFNPPHKAHRLMLEVVSTLPEVECVLVTPTNIPPHKAVKGDFAYGEYRLAMCRLLCDGINNAVVSDAELMRGGKSYSFDTLSVLKQDIPSLAMLIGGDMVTSFTNWYNYEGILNLVQLFAVRRKGIDNTEFDLAVDNLRQKGGRITVIDADVPNISSTMIRNFIDNGLDFKDIVPDNIYKFIKDNNLYTVK